MPYRSFLEHIQKYVDKSAFVGDTTLERVQMIELEDITGIEAPMERCFDLARSVEVHLLGNRHWGESAIAAGGVTSGLLELHDRVIWRARHFGLRWHLTSVITAFDRPAYFQDTQLRGPFGAMRHDHYFRAAASGRTEMRDVFTFAARVPLLGRLAEILLLRRYMRELLRERNRVIREVAESPDWGQDRRRFPGL
jgi:ligand-binding SRPBCC domain-containing protein